MKKILKFFWTYKIISALILIAVIGGGFFVYQSNNNNEGEVSYKTEVVEKSMLISSVSGTGQVSSSNQLDLHPKVSGEITSVNVKSGDSVKEGTVIAVINNNDAATDLAEARASYENAKLELEELLAPEDEYTMIQAVNSLEDARDSLVKLKFDHQIDYNKAVNDKATAEDNLVDAYENTYNDIADAFLDIPEIVTDLNTILFSDDIADSEASVSQADNYQTLINAFLSRDYDLRDDFKNSLVDKAKDYYYIAKDAYDDNFDNYQNISRYSGEVEMETVLAETIETSKKIADAIKTQTNMFDYWVEYRSDKDLEIYNKVTIYQNNLSSYTSIINNHISSLTNTKNSINGYKEDIEDAENNIKEMEQNHPLELAQAERNILEKEAKVADLKAGATELEIKNKQLAVTQKLNAYNEAIENYNDHTITALFDGVIANLDISYGDSVTTNTTIGSLITNEQMAEISLNEIDVADVEVGQKVNLTFDAIEDLEITGTVAEVDTIGAVSSGVVSYDIKITFDVNDERIKPGMSVSAAIITESKTGILIVPISAVKSQGTTSYVEVLVDGKKQRKVVTTGSANDTMIEIIEGLEEGDAVITQTINGTSGNTTTSKNASDNQDAMRNMMRMTR